VGTLFSVENMSLPRSPEDPNGANMGEVIGTLFSVQNQHMDRNPNEPAPPTMSEAVSSVFSVQNNLTQAPDAGVDAP